MIVRKLPKVTIALSRIALDFYFEEDFAYMQEPDFAAPKPGPISLSAGLSELVSTTFLWPFLPYLGVSRRRRQTMQTTPLPLLS